MDRARVAVLIAYIRWAAVALSLLESFMTSSPAPLSVTAIVAVTVLMAAYNLPLTAADRLQPRFVEPLIAVGVVGDFLVCSAWVLLSVNDPYEAPWVIYILVAIEAAVLYRWSGGLTFMLAFTTVYSVLDWIQAEYFGPPFRLDSYVFHIAAVLMVAVFTTILGNQSHRRYLAARDAAAEAAGHAERSEALYVVASRLAGTLKRDYVLETVMDSLQSLFPRRWHGILLATESGSLELAYSRGEPRGVSFPVSSAATFSEAENDVVVFGDLRSELLPNSDWVLPEALVRYASAAALPLKAPNRNFGVMLALDPAVSAFREDEVRFLEALAHQTSTALENARLYQEVEVMSLTDATTALFNRRAFDIRLDEELARAQRYNLPLALLMLDVDHFKLYNDAFGHLAGDRLLRRLGDLLAKESLRQSDLPFRFGGEEFAVIMPHTNAEEALVLAHRVCAEIVNENIPHPSNEDYGRLTVSIGVAAFPQDGAGARELVNHADVALYAAKRAGRNRVVIFNGPFVAEDQHSREEIEAKSRAALERRPGG